MGLSPFDVFVSVLQPRVGLSFGQTVWLVAAAFALTAGLVPAISFDHSRDGQAAADDFYGYPAPRYASDAFHPYRPHAEAVGGLFAPSSPRYFVPGYGYAVPGYTFWRPQSTLDRYSSFYRYGQRNAGLFLIGAGRPRVNASSPVWFLPGSPAPPVTLPLPEDRFPLSPGLGR